LFWHVYAQGTYQNRPAVGRRLYTRTPGRYLYTAQLPTLEPGSYRLRVTAEDVCGNTGSESLPIGVVERTGPPEAPAPAQPVPVPPAAPAPPGRTGAAASWPAGSTAYTVVLASVPEADAAAAAAAVAAGARAADLPRVGVLQSSEFTSLMPGYRVVFSGVYR